jgi:glucose dehydrogenase
MGMFYTAGSMVTGGGLIFNAGVTDSKVRAIDVLNGQELWTDELPAASTATPMSYVSPKSGRQYVIVTVPEGGGILQLETQVNEGGEESEVGGGWVYAYALPESVSAP